MIGLAKAILMSDLKFIADECNKEKECTKCRFYDEVEECLFNTTPENWSLKLIVEGAFKK